MRWRGRIVGLLGVPCLMLANCSEQGTETQAIVDVPMESTDDAFAPTDSVAAEEMDNEEVVVEADDVSEEGEAVVVTTIEQSGFAAPADPPSEFTFDTVTEFGVFAKVVDMNGNPAFDVTLTAAAMRNGVPVQLYRTRTDTAGEADLIVSRLWADDVITVTARKPYYQEVIVDVVMDGSIETEVTIELPLE
ncbi:MAG: hypothetical protein ACPGXK_00010 [Phycisphaerae bacterium]